MPVATASVDSSAPKIDDVLTHPVHGPVRIVSMRTRTVRGTEREYVDLVVIGDEMQISVPSDGRDVVGLRALLEESEIVELIAQLGEPIPAPEKKASWAHRIKSLQMQLQTGRLTDRIEVIRSIVRDSGGTPSSLAERNLLKQAIDPLASEIAIARSVPREDAQMLLQSTAQNALEVTAA
ncbi:MAG: CarD family transcriptional regulator [Brachybacterium sp.]|nr:CarD family transcriptional regulator [Brachybacterium sp.]MDN5899076.1 CarD family transcriptional regulator [Brachybacterium sp.]